MKGQLPLEIKKLTEEDRRFLLDRYLNEVIANHQGSMSNTNFILSLLAILFAGFSIVYQLQNLYFILTYSILSLLGLIFVIKGYKKSQAHLNLERENIGINYDELFKKHLDYATKMSKKP